LKKGKARRFMMVSAHKGHKMNNITLATNLILVRNASKLVFVDLFVDDDDLETLSIFVTVLMHIAKATPKARYFARL